MNRPMRILPVVGAVGPAAVVNSGIGATIPPPDSGSR
jgi:hypothetical protein